MNAGLHGEVERRMTAARAFDRWKHRAPWRWIPAAVRPFLFKELFVEREVRRMETEVARG